MGTNRTTLGTNASLMSEPLLISELRVTLWPLPATSIPGSPIQPILRDPPAWPPLLCLLQVQCPSLYFVTRGSGPRPQHRRDSIQCRLNTGLGFTSHPATTYRIFAEQISLPPQVSRSEPITDDQNVSGSVTRQPRILHLFLIIIKNIFPQVLPNSQGY